VGVLEASTSRLKQRYAVSNDNAFKLVQPGSVDDQLTEILRQGVRTLLAKAVEAEVADFSLKQFLSELTCTSIATALREWNENPNEPLGLRRKEKPTLLLLYIPL